jgi:hypothetical protein
MATFFQRFFLMLQKLSFYVADNVFWCCMRTPFSGRIAPSERQVFFHFVGEFRKTCHHRNVEVYEIREMSFQEQRTHEDPESWTCKVANARRSRILNLRSCKVANVRRSGILNLRSLKIANVRRSGTSNLRSLGVANVRWSGISNLRSFEVANSWRPEAMNLRNHEIGSLWNSGVCWTSSSEVTTRGDFLNGEIHEPVRSKVKDVISKSPGLACELVAGL